MANCSRDLEKYLTGRRRGLGGLYPRLKTPFCLFLFPAFLREGFGGLPSRIDTLCYLNPLLKGYFLLCSFVTRGLGGPGPPKIAIYSLKERKYSFYSLYLHLLMRPLVRSKILNCRRRSCCGKLST
jgi:hypothetical protein